MEPDERIMEQVLRVIAETLRISPDKVRIDTQLGQELGADSMDFVEIEFRLETDFEIEFYKGNTIEALSELLSPEELERNGLLTAFGAAVLQLRMPEIVPHRLQMGQPTGGIETFCTPQTWVRRINELLAVRPSSCVACGSETLKAGKFGTVICSSCKTEMSCPTGEECLAVWAKMVPAQLESNNRSENS